MKKLYSYAAVAVFSITLTLLFTRSLSQTIGQQPVEGPELPADLSQDERDSVRLYQTANRGVVNISTSTRANQRFMFDGGVMEGGGSGAVIDKQGYIVTNYHVLDGASRVKVTLFDGSEYAAVLAKGDINNDLAVFKINAPADKLFPLTWADSSKLLVGMRVWAIGNPFGLERTLTSGIISSLNRIIKSEDAGRTIRGVVQTDAAINPGNSGGPLLNRRGEIIGINTMIVTGGRVQQSAGIGLAIPANSAKKIVSDLIQFGKVSRTEIGIEAVYEIRNNRQQFQGLQIVSLRKNGPAEKAGLKAPKEVVEQGDGFVRRNIDRKNADIIIALDGKKVTSGDDFFTLIESKKAGDKVILTLLRGGENTQVEVTLDSSEKN